jgi:hypothetical protein
MDNIPKVSINVITSTAVEPAAAYIGFIGTGIFRVELEEKP